MTPEEDREVLKMSAERARQILEQAYGHRIIMGNGLWYANNDDMLRLLGVKVLPKEGMPERKIQGLTVYVKPAPEPRLVNAPGSIYHGKPFKSSRHRIMVICDCGKHVPAGRMRQHRCKEKQNESSSQKDVSHLV